MKKRILSVGSTVSVPSRPGIGTGRMIFMTSHMPATEASTLALYHHRSGAYLTTSESADSNVVICGRSGMGKTVVLADILTEFCPQDTGGRDAQ